MRLCEASLVAHLAICIPGHHPMAVVLVLFGVSEVMMRKLKCYTSSEQWCRVWLSKSSGLTSTRAPSCTPKLVSTVFVHAPERWGYNFLHSSLWLLVTIDPKSFAPIWVPRRMMIMVTWACVIASLECNVLTCHVCMRSFACASLQLLLSKLALQLG